jgi:NAD(P)-dependent dehydrogenase (short-subunit alcohol dehydrogenase family)
VSVFAFDGGIMISKNAVITGAGSGVGQATAIALAEAGWNVALLGRREDALRATATLAEKHGTRVTVHPCDIGDSSAVEAVGQKILVEFGSVQALVNSAGTNAPKRALEVLSLEDYHAMMNANLHGAYYCVQAFLSAMRAAGTGTIVNVVSDAGKQASPKAGPAYVMSKFGMAGLTQSINAEERPRGIRACAIFPGDIDTPLLNKRPVIPDAAAREKMMQPADIAACILLCIQLPARTVIEEMLVRPR